MTLFAHSRRVRSCWEGSKDCPERLLPLEPVPASSAPQARRLPMQGAIPLRPLHLQVLRLAGMKLKLTSQVSSVCSLLTSLGSLRRGF